jgi:large-conductance mechanosensitive channel
MMETEQGGAGLSRQIRAQAAREFLATICRELLDWGAIAMISLGRFLTAMLNFIMLAIAAIIAVLAWVVLILRDKIMIPSENSSFSLISIKASLEKTRASDSD